MCFGSGEGGVLDLLWKNWRGFLGNVFTFQGGVRAEVFPAEGSRTGTGKSHRVSSVPRWVYGLGCHRPSCYRAWALQRGGGSRSVLNLSPAGPDFPGDSPDS